MNYLKKLAFAVAILMTANLTTAQNKVLELDGVNDYANLGNSAGNNVRTIEMWFKPETSINSSLSRFKTLVARNTGLLGAPDHFEFGLVFAYQSGIEGKLRFFMNDQLGNTFNIYSNSNSWNAGEWYHVAAVVDPTNGMSLYVNGLKQTDTDTYNHHTDTASFYTAAGRWGDFTGNRYFDGRIDNLKFSSTALYSSNFTPECPDSATNITDIATWDFNATSTSTAFDLTTNSYDASLQGAIKVTDTICNLNNVLELDGINDYLNLGTSSGNNVRTIEMWFKPETTIDSTLNRFKTLVTRNTGLLGAPDHFEFGLVFAYQSGIEGKLRFFMNDAAGITYNIYSNSNKWDAGTWYHVAAVVDPTNGMSMFIDGIKQVDTDVYNHHTDTASFYTAAGRWGDFSGNRYFDGRIDNLKFASTALYSSNFTPECPDFVSTITDKGTWDFNTNDVLTAFDLSINNYDASIIGAVKLLEEVCQNGSPRLKADLQEINKTNTINLLVYPNPTQDIVQFELKNSIEDFNTTIQLIDITGKVIFSEQIINSKSTVDLSRFSNGFYFYRLLQNNKVVQTGKLIKQ